MDQAAYPGLHKKVSEFLTWWQYELASMIPQWLKNKLQSDRPVCAIRIKDGRITIIACSKKGSIAETKILSDEHELESTLKKYRRNRNIIGLRLAADQYFKRTLELPAGARFRIAEILDLDLERSTPFRKDSIYSGVMIAGEDGKKLSVSQIIVKKNIIQDLLKQLENTGVQPDFIDIEDQEGNALPLNILPDVTGASSKGKLSARPTRLLLSVAVVGLTGLTVNTALDRQNTALETLRKQIGAAQKKARDIQASFELQNRQLSGFYQLTDRKNGTPPAVEIWDELARRIPDSAWLQDLKIDSDRLQITGYADAAEGLIKVLDQSPFFTEVAFLSPVSMDSQKKQERFSIQARILRQSSAKTSSKGAQK